MNQLLDELDQLVTTWKADSPTCQQLPCSPLETSTQQEGLSGGRLGVKSCECGSLAPVVACFKKIPVRRESSNVSRSDVTQSDCRSSVSTINHSKHPVHTVEKQMKPAPQQGLLFSVTPR